MQRILMLLILVSGAAGAGAQDRQLDSLGTIIRIGTFLNEQNRQLVAETHVIPGQTLNVRDVFRPTQSFAVEQQFPGEFLVRDNSGWQSYTIRPQPLQGFTVQDNLHPMRSWAVSSQAFDSYAVQNRMNPGDGFTVRARSLDDFSPHGSYRVEAGYPYAGGWPSHSGPSDYRPFDGLGGFGGAPFPTHGPSLPTDPFRPASIP